MKNLNTNLNPSYFLLENFETSIPFLLLPPKFHNADKGPAMEEYSRNQEEFDAAFHAVIGSLKSEDLTLYWILYDNDNENARYKLSTYFMFVT